MKILLIDDDSVDREQIKRDLIKGGNRNEVVEASTGLGALTELNLSTFNLILLDLFLPDVDGLSLTPLIKNKIGNSNTTLIVISNNDSDHLIEPVIQAGAHSFLLKNAINAKSLKRAILESSIRRKLEIDLQISQEALKNVAEHDPLTGLSNRYLFDKALTNLLKSKQRKDLKIAILLIDLDNFKYVNDHFGHHIGNQLLIRVTARIKSCLREHENLFRLGGDEFVIILGDLENIFEASAVALRINRVLRKAFEIESFSISSSASIGIAIYPDNSTNPVELVQFADIAMYRAKEKGKEQTCFFEESMQETFIRRFELERNLRIALEKHQFELYYQPIFSNKDLKVAGFEALIRWNKNGKMIPPDEFIPIAESCGIIGELGLWIVHTALIQLAQWQCQSPNIRMNINLSAVQLRDHSLINSIKRWIAEENLDARSITFELTETAFIYPTPETINRINALRILGCSIALDDFGTGFSSLSHLLNFPLDTVKIDKSILPPQHVNPMQDKKTIYQVFYGITNMLLALNHKIVVEGVETQEQLELCCAMEVNFLQGYFLAMPEPANLASLRLGHTEH